MGSLQHQRGMTAIGWIFVLIMIAFGSLVVMRLTPIYIESFKVDSALKSIAKSGDVKNASPVEIRKQFMRRMDIEDVDRFTDVNIREYLMITKDDGRVNLSIQYEARAPLFYNLSIVADIDKQVTVY